VVATVPTQKSARTIAFDPATHRLMLPAADFEPPAPDADPQTRPAMKADSFAIVVVGPADAR